MKWDNDYGKEINQLGRIYSSLDIFKEHYSPPTHFFLTLKFNSISDRLKKKTKQQTNKNQTTSKTIIFFSLKF